MIPDLTGQFGVSTIQGRTGWWIGLCLHCCGDGAPVSHAFQVVGDHVVEAMPTGARLTPLKQYLGRTDVYFSQMDLTEEQKQTIVDNAMALIGAKYNFLDYLALALNIWGVRPKWLRDHLASSDRLICSQLVDTVMARSGIHLFPDGRDYGAVTPGDLYRWLAVHGSLHRGLITEGESV